MKDVKNEIVEYVKEKVNEDQTRLIGCVVSKKIKVNDHYEWNIGFSILHPNDVYMEIPFNKEYGYMIAARKAEGNVNRLKHIFIPERAKETILKVISRSRRYFKDCVYSERSKIIMEMIDYKE